MKTAKNSKKTFTPLCESLLEAGAISWDGSFDWPKRSDAINKTRPNDAPTSMPPPKPRGEGVVVFVKFAVKKITFLRAFAA